MHERERCKKNKGSRTAHVCCLSLTLPPTRFYLHYFISMCWRPEFFLNESYSVVRNHLKTYPLVEYVWNNIIEETDSETRLNYISENAEILYKIVKNMETCPGVFILCILWMNRFFYQLQCLNSMVKNVAFSKVV